MRHLSISAVFRACLMFSSLSIMPILGGCGPNTTTSEIDKSGFITLAKAAPCSDLRNRLYIIDKQYVLWDRAGNCPDNSYGQTLYGKTPSVVLAETYDSIAGPMTRYQDESVRTLFSTIIANLTKPDLGLGSTRHIELVSF